MTSTYDDPQPVVLGSTYRDVATGWRGVAVAWTRWLHSDDSVTLAAEDDPAYMLNLPVGRIELAAMGDVYLEQLIEEKGAAAAVEVLKPLGVEPLTRDGEVIGGVFPRTVDPD